jgi:hypothetical protein
MPVISTRLAMISIHWRRIGCTLGFVGLETMKSRMTGL